MIKASELKKGRVIQHEGALYTVSDGGIVCLGKGVTAKL